MREAGIIEEDRSTEVPPHRTSQTSQLLLLDSKQVLLSNTGLSRMARLPCPNSALPAGRGRRPGVLGCVHRGQSPGFCLHCWKLEAERAAKPASRPESQLAPGKPCLCQSVVSTVAERGYGMDEKIRLERGRSRRMENWGLACSLDSKEHTVFTTQA